jgi:polyisoprenoid-binding protein YceI
VALSSPSATPSASSSAAASGAGTSNADGTWAVVPASSVSGYRIDEEVSGIGANTAVGRTSSVSGSMTIDGTSVTTLDVTVDMSSLQSDDDRRDGQLRQRGIQTDSFPTATFTLTEPIDVGSVPKSGETVNATATGDLTLHGVTKSVSVPVQARWNGETVEVVGSVDVALADYGIEPPVGFLVLSIADHGTIEFDLFFTRS